MLITVACWQQRGFKDRRGRGMDGWREGALFGHHQHPPSPPSFLFRQIRYLILPVFSALSPLPRNCGLSDMSEDVNGASSSFLRHGRTGNKTEMNLRACSSKLLGSHISTGVTRHQPLGKVTSWKKQFIESSLLLGMTCEYSNPEQEQREWLSSPGFMGT